MRKKILYLLVIILTLASCSSQSGNIYNTNKSRKKSPPSGKYKNPRMFSHANPFQGKAKAKLEKSKKKRKKFYRKKRGSGGAYRSNKKRGKAFGNRRSLSRGRLKSSGSRTKSRGGGRKSNKNLFNTRKK